MTISIPILIIFIFPFIPRYYYQYYAWYRITNKSTARNKVIMSVIADILFILTYIFAIAIPAFYDITIGDINWTCYHYSNICDLKREEVYAYIPRMVFGSFISICIMAILYYKIWAKFEDNYNLFKSKLNLIGAPCISKFSNRTWNWIVLFFILIMNTQFNSRHNSEVIVIVGIPLFTFFWVPYWYKLCKVIDYFKENPLIAQNENIEDKNK